MDGDELIQSGQEEGEQCDDNGCGELSEGIVGATTSSSSDLLARLPLSEVRQPLNVLIRYYGECVSNPDP